jgi:DnaK suppressor protein
MNKKTIEELKEKLLKEKNSIEEELKSFAKEDSKGKGDWDAKFPKFAGGNGDLEEEADEVQEYEKLVSIEHSLELKLRDVNLALGKIKKEKYGDCEKCGKEIDTKRLKACPEARFCTKHKNPI